MFHTNHKNPPTSEGVPERRGEKREERKGMKEEGWKGGKQNKAKVSDL